MEDQAVDSDDGSLAINTGRSILIPLIIDPNSIRQFPEQPIIVEVLEGDLNFGDPEPSTSLVETTKIEAIPHITAEIPWEVSVPESLSLVKRSGSPPRDASGYEHVRKTYNLMSSKTLQKVGYIDLGIRLTYLGNNFWTRMQKFNRKRSTIFTELERIPIISEPQTEEEAALTQTEEETASFLIGTPENFPKDSTVANKFPIIKKQISANQSDKKVTFVDPNKKINDTLENVLKSLLKYDPYQSITSLTPHNILEEFNVNVCDTKSCPNPPRDRYDAGIHSCSEIFGRGSARSKFCRKSKKPQFSFKIPCTNKTCLARHPLAKPTCGPCMTDAIPPGVCCPIPGRICPDCGGFSASGRTCYGLKLWRKRHPIADLRARKRHKNRRTIYDCLKVCPSRKIMSKNVPYPGRCYPHGVPDDGGGACILQDGPNVQPRILRGPIRVPFGAGRELPLRRPKVKIPIPAESAYVYTAGERYASARSRHQNCNTTECTKKIPPNMGWLWSHRPLPGVKKLPNDWRPGLINDDIKTLAEERRNKQLQEATNLPVRAKPKKQNTENIYMVFVQPDNTKNLLIDGIESHIEFDLQNFHKIVETALSGEETERQRERACLRTIQFNIGDICKRICYEAIEELEI